MLEIITLGGGQHIVNVLNAVAAWCGGGGFRSMLQVVMVMGLAYALLIMAMSLNWKAAFNWFLTSTAIYMCMIVPTTTVVVVDRLNPTVGNGAVANVPIGLAAIASFTSQIGDWLTRTAETVFVEPNALTMTSYGMLYPTRVNELSQQFVVTNPVLKQNIESYITQCYLYGVMIHAGSATALQQVAASPDLLSALGPGSSSRMVQFTSDSGSNVILCSDAYNQIKAGYAQLASDAFNQVAPSFYPYLSAQQAVAKLQNDLPVVTQGLYGTAMSAQLVFQQRSLVNAFMEARANLGGGDGDSFAAMHADVQARNVMIASARQAMTWVPVLNLVLTIVFYAMFPVIFPLFLLPSGGVAALKGYLTGFFYLASWGPLSAVLHMFITSEAAAQLTAAASGNGMTMAAMPSIDAIDQNAAVLAGFLLMSVPLLAGGMAKGAMTLAHNAGQLLAPVQHGAEAAGVERTTGDYAYGNVTANQWNTAASHRDGYATSTMVNANGTEVMRTADGSQVYNNASGISKLGFSPSEVQGLMRNVSDSAAAFHNQATAYRQSASQSYSAGFARVHAVTQGAGTHVGGDTTTGVRTTGGHALSQNDALQSNDTIRSGYELGQREGVSQTATDRTTRSASLNATTTLGLGGNIGPVSVGGRVTGGIGIDRSRSKTDQRELGASFTDTSGQNQSDTIYASNGEAITFSHEGFTSNGHYYRYDKFNATRDSRERRFSEARTLENQASRSEEEGQRLDHVVSESRNQGWQLSDDMSQIVASHYNQIAQNKYAGLGAPALNQVDLTPRQRELRNAIVGEVLQDYALSGGIETPRHLADTPAMGSVVSPPPSFTVAELRGAVGPMPHGGHGGRPQAPAEIAEAKADVASGRDRLTASQRGTVEVLNQMNDLTNAKLTEH